MDRIGTEKRCSRQLAKDAPAASPPRTSEPDSWRLTSRVRSPWQKSWNPVPDPSPPRVSSALVQGGQVSENRIRSWPTVVILDRKSTRLNSSHGYISYAVFCLKKKKNNSSI